MNSRLSRMHIVNKICDSMLFRPYKWGGDDPIEGLDCSGFIIEVLKSVGVLPYNGDWTALGLSEFYKNKKVISNQELESGCLIFYGSPIWHVEMVYGILDYNKKSEANNIIMIGAMGGDGSVLTVEDAKKKNAYIKIRPMKSGVTAMVDPFMGEV